MVDIIVFVYAIGIAVVGGIFAWTFTKSGKKGLTNL